MILFKFTDTTAPHRCQCMLHSCNGLLNDKKYTLLQNFLHIRNTDVGRKAANYKTTATSHVQIGCSYVHVLLVNGGTATSTGEYGYITVCIALPLAGRSCAHWREVSMSPDCIIHKNVFTFILFFLVCRKTVTIPPLTLTYNLHCMSDSACLGHSHLQSCCHFQSEK